MTKFITTFPNGETLTSELEFVHGHEIFIGSWWSFDEAGELIYEYDGTPDTVVQLTNTMYFHCEVIDVPEDAEITFQLYDYDYTLFERFEHADPDDSKFPKEPIIKKVKLQKIGTKTMAIIKLYLDEKWEKVVGDDHNGFKFAKDQAIELYWQARYEGRREELPPIKKRYLRVGHIERDLFLIPATEGADTPEIRDKTGKIIKFLIKRGNDIAKAFGSKEPISHFTVVKIKTTTVTKTLFDVNAVKRRIFVDEINLDTNVSTKLGYEVEEAAEYFLKDKISSIDIVETEKKVAKKFSQYFNARNIDKGIVKAFHFAREALRVLDYVAVGQTLHSLFPSEGGMFLDIPKPSSTFSVISTFKLLKNTGGISAVMFAADILASQVVEQAMKELDEDIRIVLEYAKSQGIDALRDFRDTTGADIAGYDLIEPISQTLHEKVMCGEIIHFNELIDQKGSDTSFDFDSDEGMLTYAYLVRKTANKHREQDIYTIEMIIPLFL